MHKVYQFDSNIVGVTLRQYVGSQQMDGFNEKTKSHQICFIFIPIEKLANKINIFRNNNNYKECLYIFCSSCLVEFIDQE